MDDELESIVCPHKHDTIFRADSQDVLANACLNYSDSTDVLYAEGYKRAARLLTKQVLETYSDQDFLVFPIVYLYRHHLELAIKRLTRIGCFIADWELTETEIRHLEKHRLDLLWNNFKPIMKTVCQLTGWEMPDEDIKGVDSYIRQLADADPASQGFRYPCSKKGERSVPQLRHINIRVFAEAMEWIADFFEGVDAGFVHLADAKSEILSHWRSEMAF